jgi:hypothetical protein
MPSKTKKSEDDDVAEPDRAVKFITKLVKLTQERKVEWGSTSSPEAGGTAFMAEIDGRRIRLYQYSKEVPNPDYATFASPFSVTSSAAISLFGPKPPPPQTILQAGTVLEIFDDGGRAAYKFENRTGLRDLYESASYSAAKVDDLIDSVLGKD